MAIGINKRKRKYENISTVEEDNCEEDVAVPPEKKAKHTDASSKSTEVMAEPSSDTKKFDATKEKNMKFSKEFKMLSFRTKLKGDNFITELRHFLYLAQSSLKIVAKYLEKRGKPLELVEAVERIDKTNVLHVGFVCEALYLVLMEILGNQRQHLESAVHACRFFLKAHNTCIELLLKSPQFKHRCIALKLLTAFVCTEPNLGRHILTSFDVLNNVNTVDQFLSHSHTELQQQQEKLDTVRKCFIHFALAYLIDGNMLLVRNLLSKAYLIKCLINGLLYDDATTVCMVLSTMKQFILQCAEITKTTKIHVFDLNCCKSLLKLYDWCGPKAFAAKRSVRKGAKEMQLVRSNVEHLVDANEREIVAKAIHEFMLVLLTSRKYGISFDSKKYFQQKRNTIQGQLMPAIQCPWSSTLKSELIVKILESCPDLFRHTVRNFSGIINPLRCGRKFYKSVVEFLIKIIGACNPGLLDTALEKITLTDLTYWVKDICLPLETLVHVKGSKLLYEKEFETRLITNRLLLTMFIQYKNWIRAIAEREKKFNRNSSVNALRKFKFDILNHLLLHFPTMEDILMSLNISVKEQHEDGVDVLRHLDTTLDLILLICQDNRTFVNKTSTILNYLELLQPLYASNDDDNVNHVNSNTHLEMKAIKTILILSPKDLEPQKERFATIMQSFIKAFVYGSEEINREAGDLLRNIFRNTGIFHDSDLEIDLWLEPLKYFDIETVQVVCQVFTEVLKVTEADVELPRTVETTANVENLQQLFKNIEAGLSVQSYVETLVLSKLMHLILKGVEIEEPLKNYLECVSLLLFHYHTDPLEVTRLCETQFIPLAKYMKRTLREGKSFKLDMYCPIPKMLEVSEYIHQESCTFEKLMENQLNNERLSMIYVQLIIFQVLQVREKQKLTNKQAERAAEFITNTLKSIEVYQSNEHKSTENENFAYKLIRYIYGVRLNQVTGQDLLETFESNINYLRFLKQVTAYCKKFDSFHVHTRNYKTILVKAVAISMRCKDLIKANTNCLKDFLEILKVFDLDEKHCCDLLNLYADHLNYKDIFMEQQSPSFTIYYFLLVFTMERLADLQQAVECKEFIRKFTKIYQQLHKKLPEDLRNLDQLDAAFYRFLLINHHYLKDLDEKFFACSFSMEWKTNKSQIKLAHLIYQRNDSLKECLLPYLSSQELEKKELMYALIDEAFKKNLILETEIIQKLYSTFRIGFMRAIEKPHKAGQIYKDHAEVSKKLIELGMPATECRDFCRKQLKFDGIESYQLQLIDAIYTKAFKTSTESHEKSIILVNFISLMISMSLSGLKMQKLTYEKLQLIAFLLQKWMKDDYQNLSEIDFSRIMKSTQWQQFCKICLKRGMEINEPTESTDNEPFKALLLQLLACLNDYLIEDNQEDLNSSEFSLLFLMIFEHSKFQTIISNSINIKQKTATLHLLYVLAKKCPAVLQVHQVPLILSAYQGRLSRSDRFSLALLNLYELHLPQEIQQFKPFVWGETASTFYALTGNEEDHLKLQQPETTINQIMSLIDRQVCEYTLENFPIWRKLNTLQQLPEVIFENPLNRLLLFEDNNEMEKKIEKEEIEFSASELRLCFKRADIYDQCYDPAFMIPLMVSCFAPGSSAHPARPVQNGLLALSFAALSSQDREMRLAAGSVQLRYRSHFEQSKFFEKPFWIQTYENLQSGLNDLRNAWLKNKSNGGTPCVPYIPVLFVAKAFNITCEPTHLLYKPLTMYLRLKQSFDFQCIPEFNVLFYSSEVEHQEYRRFIMEIILYGVKCNSDLFLLISTNTFKVLMAFYNAPMSTLDLNLLILALFSTCTKIPSASKLLIENVGILSWLSTIVQTMEFHQFDIIEGLICILNNLWYSLKVQQREFHNFLYLEKEIHKIIIQLLPLISLRISLPRFAKLMNIMYKTAHEKSQYLALSLKDLQQLLLCAEKYFGKLVLPLSAILMYGGQGCSKFQEYNKELLDLQVDSNSRLALCSLRSYLIHWSSVSLNRIEEDFSIETEPAIQI